MPSLSGARRSRATMDNHLIVLRGARCRRSQRVIAWLTERGIPFSLYDINSPEGQAFARQYDLRASPGLIKNGRVINPFDLLRACRVDEQVAQALLEG